MLSSRLPETLSDLPSVVIVVGHYGVGKTNLSVNLARDLAADGRSVTVADLDVVNPFFRSSDYADELAREGVSVIKPELAGSALDIPAISGRVEAAIDEARESPDRVLLFDVGGDDVGATALGRFSSVIAAGPYAMLYVVNAFREDRDDVGAAAALLARIEENSHLAATAIINNSHLQGETSRTHIERGREFAEGVSGRTGLPVLATTIPKINSLETVMDFVGNDSYIVSITVKTPWDAV